jgi:hypothetical protein
MRLYEGMSRVFVEDAVRNQIADKLRDAFFAFYGYRPSFSEVASWRNSLRTMAGILERGHLDDNGVILEYQLPLSSKRLDFLICGVDEEKKANAVIVELKQWERCDSSEVDRCVSTWLGGKHREILHPCEQAAQYRRYLEDVHTSFYEGDRPIGLRSCAYLHNYTAESGDPLFDPKFDGARAQTPLFTGPDVEELTSFLQPPVGCGSGAEVLSRIEGGRARPSKKLLEHVANVINGRPEFVLLDEQLVVFEKVFACIRRSIHDRKQRAVLVKGGPGTGKLVVAINLMADLSRAGYNAQYATGSKAFTETLRKKLGPRGSSQCTYFNSYAAAEKGAVDVLVCDEAHRIRRTSVSRFTPRAKKTGLPQTDELMAAAKVPVFFIDDKQNVRPDETGSVELIRTTAARLGVELSEFELETQFRCAGSDHFVRWVGNTLSVESNQDALYSKDEGFDFRIVSTPEELDSLIRERASAGFTARLTAGFCWPWSDPEPDGSLVNDVKIGTFIRPWNAKPETKHRLKKGIPKSTLWATDHNGIEQIGCIYTAQGFEFDYVGVIWGKDLVYDFRQQTWAGSPADSRDKAVKSAKGNFAELVKHSYRVLLSRGIKGCYVCFLDEDTKRFVESRIGAVSEASTTEPRRAKPVTAREELPAAPTRLPFRVLERSEARPWVNCVPLVALEAAAGAFSGEQQVDELDLDPSSTKWVELPDAFRPSRGLFVARVVGESMNRRIPNGSWCLFRRAAAGSRNGRVVLAAHRDISDSETGGHYTVKVYSSEKTQELGGEWLHSAIALVPDSSDPSFQPLHLDQKAAEQLRIVADLVAVLG